MKNQKGFSLIELLIVVVIIGIIAAIAIPNLLAARRAANEGSAQSTNRTIHSAQVTYASTVGNRDYAATLADLNTQGLIDSQLRLGSKSGYNFTTVRVLRVAGTSEAEFAIGSVPTTPSGVSQSGTRKFCVATDGVVKSNTAALSTAIAAVSDCSDANYPVVVE